MGWTCPVQINQVWWGIVYPSCDWWGKLASEPIALVHPFHYMICILYELCYNIICILLCFHQARTIWFYCTDKVYCYQLILKFVFFYTLMETGALVNEMLLMMSGDIESNPGPREYLYCSISPGLTQYLLSLQALPLHFQYMYYNWVERIVANSKYSTLQFCWYWLCWRLLNIHARIWCESISQTLVGGYTDEHAAVLFFITQSLNSLPKITLYRT